MTEMSTTFNPIKFGHVEFGNKVNNSNKEQTNKLHITNNSRTIVDVLKEDLYNSYSQAIIKIALTPYLSLKLLLAISVALSSCLVSYLVISSIITFLSFGVSTTSRTIYENPTLFPKVTICNVNWFTTQFAFNFTKHGTKWSEISNFSEKEQKKLGHNLTEILFDCSFNLNPCFATDFHWSFDADYGNCYTFNSGFDSHKRNVGLKKSNISSPDLGLQLTLYVNIYEPLLNNTSGDVYGLGGVIRLGNSSYLTYDSSSDILVASGFQTNIAVRREFKKMLPNPYSQCELEMNSNSDLYNLIGQSHK